MDAGQPAEVPLLFALWFQWMFWVIVVAPVLFVRRRQGRIVLVFSAVFVAVQFPLLQMVGLTNLLSLSHLLIWTPLVFYLLRELRARRIEPRSPFGVWALTAGATAIISLVFDVRDFGRWLAGARGPAQLPAWEQATMPWFWLAAIALALLAAGWTVFRLRAAP